MTNYAWSTGSTGYDDKDRLINWTRAAGDTQTWNLSLVGNWTNTVVNGTTDTRTHNVVHELLTRSTSTTSLTYDPKGNMTTNSNGQTYTWDYDNYLSSSTVFGATATYSYDAIGRRVTKTVGASITFYVSLLKQEIAEYEPTALVRRFIYGTYIDEPLMLVSGSGASETRDYYHSNSLYSIAALTSAAGAVVERYVYTPYGDTTISSSAGSDGVWFTSDDTYVNCSAFGNPFAYTGGRMDSETGLYEYRARFYDGRLGRFLRRDPLIYVDGFNLYEYAKDSPLSQADWSGLAGNTPTTDAEDGWNTSGVDSGSGVNCLLWAFNDPNLTNGVIDFSAYQVANPNINMDLGKVLSSKAMLKNVMNAWLNDPKSKVRGYKIPCKGPPTPCKPGYHRVALFLQRSFWSLVSSGFESARDYHFITESSDGTWTGKPGWEATVGETSIARERGGTFGCSWLVGCWCVHSPPRSNYPSMLIIRKANLWNDVNSGPPDSGGG